MSWTETFNCDICGKQKGSTDHWWLAWSEPFSPHPDAPERNMLKIYPWENMLAHDASAKHLCGQACLQKLVDRWLNTEMAQRMVPQAMVLQAMVPRRLRRNKSRSIFFSNQHFFKPALFQVDGFLK